MNKMPRPFRFWTAMLVIASLSALNISPAAAGLTPSRASATTSIETSRAADLIVTSRALENKVVAQKLLDYGVSAADVQLRLASMSDQDLHTLASSAKGLPSGGDATGAIIGVLVVVILVIVVLRLMNRQVVVK